MRAKRRFPSATVAAIRDGQMLGIRAGTQPHRIIGIWAVVVEGRVFVRSWSLKPRSWYRTFLQEPRGVISGAGREIPVRAVRTRSERLKDAIDRAYLGKYHTPASIKYARDLGRAKSRATTIELLPGWGAKTGGGARRLASGGRRPAARGLTRTILRGRRTRRRANEA